MVGSFRGKDLQIPPPLIHPPDRRNNSSKADDATGPHWAGIRGLNQMSGECRSRLCVGVHVLMMWEQEERGS